MKDVWTLDASEIGFHIDDDFPISTKVKLIGSGGCGSVLLKED
jgi:hypothetical protein